MSYNGSGTFNINTAGQPVVTGTVISSTAFNALTADLGTGLTTAITKDGQTATTARIPFAAGINSTLVTDSTGTGTGSIITAGGVGIAKALWVGGLANIAGVLSTIAHTITSASANAFSVGRQGTTDPALNVDASTALSATGVNIKSAAAAGGVAVSVISSGANEALTVNAKGSGTIGIGSVSTGAVTITPATTISGAATLSSTLAVTGITTVAAGSAALPAIISTTGTADTGLWFPAADTLAASTAGTERMRIDSSGNVGIGTSSPGFKLEVVCGTNNGIHLKDAASATVYGGLFTQSAALALITRSNHSLVFGTNDTTRFTIDSSGNVGIGTTSPSYQLQVNTDSAGKPGVGGLWTVVSDERIKSNIVPANLDRCYEIVKSVPLKYFGFAPGVYTDDQINDKHNLGWIAQDVQKVFKNAVSVKPFTLKTDIPDGVEEYQEQDFTTETVEKTETSIQVIDGKAVQVSKVVASENKVMLFDTVDVLDEAGVAVMDGDKPLTYQMPRMITKTRPKVRHDVIEDCLDLNSGQMIAALYGCVQALMAKVEALEAKA